jgi:hypothetical protein
MMARRCRSHLFQQGGDEQQAGEAKQCAVADSLRLRSVFNQHVTSVPAAEPFTLSSPPH